MSEAKAKPTLLEALLAAQAEFPEIPKDRENTYFKSKYSTLDAIISAVRPVLNKHGIILDHTTEIINGQWCEVARLTHAATGEVRTNAHPLAADFGSLSTQARGSEVTYGRRYSLAPMLGITSDEDDDGNAADSRHKGEKAAGKKSAPPRSDNPFREEQQRRAPAGKPPVKESKPTGPPKTALELVDETKNPQALWTLLQKLLKQKPVAANHAAWVPIYTAAAKLLGARGWHGDAAKPVEGLLHEIGDAIDKAELDQQSRDTFGGEQPEESKES